MEKAGSEMIKIFNSKNLEIETKSNNTPVTIADKISNDIIIFELEKISNIPIISEESEKINNPLFNTYWLIDPLDGTKCFIEKDNDFSIMISLIIENKPHFSAVYVPMKKIFYYAQKNKGSFFIDSENKTFKMNCNKNTKLSDFKMVISKHHFTDEDKKYSELLGIVNYIKMGSIGIKLAEIANTNSDIYLNFDGLNQWDLAPGQLILEEAGGIVFDKSGNEFSYNSSNLRFKNGVIAISCKNRKSEIIKNINNGD